MCGDVADGLFLLYPHSSRKHSKETYGRIADPKTASKFDRLQYAKVNETSARNCNGLKWFEASSPSKCLKTDTDNS